MNTKVTVYPAGDEGLANGTVKRLRQFPTCLEATYVEAHRGASGFHESLLRSFQVLEVVRGYLRQGAPPKVILDVIDAAYETDMP